MDSAPSFTIGTHADVREVPCPDEVDCGYVHRELTGAGHLDCDACDLHQPTESLDELRTAHHAHLRAHTADFAAHGIDILELLGV